MVTQERRTDGGRERREGGKKGRYFGEKERKEERKLD